MLADYVDLETGTGAVHTAPGHGADDFDTGVKYGLPILNPVDAAGRFTAEAGPYAGLQIFEANEKIVEDLRESGALWSAARVRAFVSALLALPQSRDLPRDRAVVSSRWIRTCCASARSTRSTAWSTRRRGDARASGR